MRAEQQKCEFNKGLHAAWETTETAKEEMESAVQGVQYKKTTKKRN